MQKIYKLASYLVVISNLVSCGVKNENVLERVENVPRYVKDELWQKVYIDILNEKVEVPNIDVWNYAKLQDLDLDGVPELILLYDGVTNGEDTREKIISYKNNEVVMIDESEDYSLFGDFQLYYDEKTNDFKLLKTVTYWDEDDYYGYLFEMDCSDIYNIRSKEISSYRNDGKDDDEYQKESVERDTNEEIEKDIEKIVGDYVYIPNYDVEYIIGYSYYGEVERDFKNVEEWVTQWEPLTTNDIESALNLNETPVK